MLVRRLYRLLRHFRSDHFRPMPPAAWLIELCVLCLDLVCIGELYVAANRLLKPSVRRLTARELALARSVFGESLPYDSIFIDERARIGCRTGTRGFVGRCAGKRAGMYRELQLLVRDEGGVVIPLFANDVFATSAKVRHGRLLQHLDDLVTRAEIVRGEAGDQHGGAARPC